MRYGGRMATRDTRWLQTLYPENADRTLPWGETGAHVTLYRPVGLAELRLLAENAWQAFPPRLPDQPIFYPVLNFSYAEEIARDWNAKTPLVRLRHSLSRPGRCRHPLRDPGGRQ